MNTIAAADCETDPFRLGRVIKPFVWGIYDGTTYFDWWGDDATSRFIAHLRTLETPLTIYAHNGGKFDWVFLMDYLDPDIMFINGRIVKATIGIHEIRDSYVNLPVPLKAFGNKIDIDYAKLEAHRRDKHKKEIRQYLKQDCVGLRVGITRWLEIFGTRSLTMASAAMRQLHKSLADKGQKIDRFSEALDNVFRPYYFGGRVQCFEHGILTPRGDSFKLYDRTSMYPAEMHDIEHPISSRYTVSDKLTDKTDFLKVEGYSNGHFPYRAANGSLSFLPRGCIASPEIFYTTGHELRAGIARGVFNLTRIHVAYTFSSRTTFADFITTFMDRRYQSRDVDKDELLALFWKLVMNSAYGKAAIDPRKFRENALLPHDVLPDGQLHTDPAIAAMQPGEAQEAALAMAWRPTVASQSWTIWERGTVTNGRFLNVAMAASITGAARASLMNALLNATRPIYCDTDSIVCEQLTGVAIGKKLGEWKLEAVADKAAIAGKKLYALYGDASIEDDEIAKRTKQWGDVRCVKAASKGVRLSAREIHAAAEGRAFTSVPFAPTMKMDGRQVYTPRRITRTT